MPATEPAPGQARALVRRVAGLLALRAPLIEGLPRGRAAEPGIVMTSSLAPGMHVAGALIGPGTGDALGVAKVKSVLTAAPPVGRV
jgi:hypothetical protein